MMWRWARRRAWVKRQPLCAVLTVILLLHLWRRDGGPPSVAWSGPRDPSSAFVVIKNLRASCGRSELYKTHWRWFGKSWRPTLSNSELQRLIQDAMKVCTRMPNCTVFTIDASTSQIHFCSAYYNQGPEYKEDWHTVAYQNCHPNASRYSLLADAGISLSQPPALANGIPARCIASTPGDTVPPSVAELYTMHRDIRANCGGNKLVTYPMASLAQALLHCTSTPPCTVVSWHKSTGTVRLCSTQDVWGPHDVRLERAAASWTTAVRRAEEESVPMCGACPTGLFLALGCGVDHRHVCHECERGSCPILNGNVNTEFTTTLRDAVSTIPWQKRSNFPVALINPSFVEFDGNHLMLGRATDNSHCFGSEDNRIEKHQFYQSKVLMCKMKFPEQNGNWPQFYPSGDARSCWTPDIDPDWLLWRSKYRYSKKDPFQGFEDARGFSVRNQLYLIGSVVARVPQGAHTSRVALIRMDSTLRKGTSAVVLFLADDGKCVDNSERAEKNWVFVRVAEDNQLLFIYSFVPFHIVRCNQNTGCCRREPSSFTHSRLSEKLAGYHGGSPVAPMGSDFATIVHRRVSIKSVGLTNIYGAVYHHRIVVFSADTFSLRAVSEPFRLPNPQGKVQYDNVLSNEPVNDIQFAAGLAHWKSELFIGYGVGDCFSAMIRVPAQTLSALDNMIAREKKLQDAAQRSPSHAADGKTVSVRIEGPILSMESFAMVNRHIGAAFYHDSKNAYSLRFADTATAGAVAEWEDFANRSHYDDSWIKDRRISGSLMNLADENSAEITIRNSWPTNMHKPNYGRLVLYFPWEFFYIPVEWAEDMTRNVDEVWAPTTFVKDGLVASGVPEGKIAIVPHGVDLETRVGPDATFWLQIEADRICGPGAFKFLFHGGMLFRKGADLLLEAYLREFSRADNVCLIVHSTYWDEFVWTRLLDILGDRSVQDGCLWRPVLRPLHASPTEVLTTEKSKSFPPLKRPLLGKIRCGQMETCHMFCITDDGYQYYHHDPNPTIGAFQWTWDLRPTVDLGIYRNKCFAKYQNRSIPADPKRLSPSLVLTTQFLSSEERSQLFSMSNVLVHASRSEGFGLSVAQAMAAGLSVITTDKGAVADFTSADTVWQVESTYVTCTAYPCFMDNATGVDVPTLFGLPTKGMPKWLNFSSSELGNVMRRTWKEPIAVQSKVEKAKRYVMEKMQWSSVATILRNRLHAVQGSRSQT